MDESNNHRLGPKWPFDEPPSKNYQYGGRKSEGYGGFDAVDFETIFSQEASSLGVNHSPDTQQSGCDGWRIHDRLPSSGDIAHYGNFNLGTGLLSPLEGSIDLLCQAPTETWYFFSSALNSTAEIPLPSQGVTDPVWSLGLTAMDLDLSYQDAETVVSPPSLAVERSSSHASHANSPSSISLGQLTPDSHKSSGTVAGSQKATKPRAATKRSQAQKARRRLSPNTTAPPPANFACRFPPCSQSFTKLHKLKRHENTHTLPFRCPVPHCSQRSAERKGIQRHLWTAHKAYAELEGTRSEKQRCSVEGCGMECRGDNLKRHMRLVHGISSTPRMASSIRQFSL